MNCQGTVACDLPWCAEHRFPELIERHATLMEAARDLVELEPECACTDGRRTCIYCRSSETTGVVTHRPDCPWLRIRALVDVVVPIEGAPASG